jgi:hypothetical protein
MEWDIFVDIFLYGMILLKWVFKIGSEDVDWIYLAQDMD